jgi:predicted nucleic acid-binding protein
MPDWADSPADWETILAVLISASLILGWLIRSAVRQNLNAIQENTAETKANGLQMIPNHGTSLRDAVDRIENHILRVEDAIHHVDRKVDGHINWHMERDSNG